MVNVDGQENSVQPAPRRPRMHLLHDKFILPVSMGLWVFIEYGSTI